MVSAWSLSMIRYYHIPVGGWAAHCMMYDTVPLVPGHSSRSSSSAFFFPRRTGDATGAPISLS